MRPVSLVVGGFLAAVLWFDLMFDVQVFGQPPGPLDAAVLDSIASYYQRVVIDASPMGRLVGLMMGIGWLSVGFQLRRRELVGATGWTTAALLFAPTTLAALRVVPNAARLAGRADAVEVQSELARTIAWDHVVCLGAIVAFVALQLWTGRAPARAR